MCGGVRQGQDFHTESRVVIDKSIWGFHCCDLGSVQSLKGEVRCRKPHGKKKKTQKGHLDPREDNSSFPISYPGFGILIGSRKESLWQESDQQGRALLPGESNGQRSLAGYSP